MNNPTETKQFNRECAEALGCILPYPSCTYFVNIPDAIEALLKSEHEAVSMQPYHASGIVGFNMLRFHASYDWAMLLVRAVADRLKIDVHTCFIAYLDIGPDLRYIQISRAALTVLKENHRQEERG